MLVSLGHESSALGVAASTVTLWTCCVIDGVDAALAPAIERLGLRVLVTETVMTDDESRRRLAAETLAAAAAMSERRIVAIIPVGWLDGAKSRLGGALDAEERRDLVTRMLARTVAAAIATPGLAETVVISPDREALDVASAAGARTMRQRTQGLNAGLVEARDDAVAGGASAVLILPIDLPLVTPARAR